MSNRVELRDVVDSDIDIFFQYYQSPKAQQLAAFISANPDNRSAYNKHWKKLLEDPEISTQTILYNGEIAGHISKFVMFNVPEITYWLGEKYWGKGIATRAVDLFLEKVSIRPIYGRAAKDNIASIRVLEKCGFEKTGEGRGYANARGKVIDEVVLKFS